MAKKNPRNKGLGRGLGSILPTDLPSQPTPNTVKEIFEIPLHKIERNPYQPRLEFEEIPLQELADSIKMHGIIQPITVRKIDGKDMFQLISGERRLKASGRAGLKAIPAYIRTANDEEMLEMALIENIQREDLNPIEIATSYQRMIKELGIDQNELGDKVGKNRSTVSNFIGLLELPNQLQASLKEGSISTGHAKALKSLKDPLLMISVLEDVLQKEMSVRQTESLVRRLKENKKKPAKPLDKPGSDQIHLNKVGEQLTARFGNKVKLTQKNNGQGEISITFGSTEDLNRILALLEE